MNRALPTLVLHTRDAAFARRADAYLDGIGPILRTTSADELQQARERFAPVVLLLDLRTAEARDHLADLARESARGLCIAFGKPASEPALAAHDAGAYAVEDVEGEVGRLQAVVRRAVAHLGMREELESLRETSTRPVSPPAPVPFARATRSGDTLSLRHFSRALRHMDNLDGMLDRIVEGLASAAVLNRVALFARIRNDTTYALRAGLHVQPEVARLTFPPADPFVRWVEQHGHLLSRASLDQVADAGARTLLRRTMDALGAEIVAPLQARGRLLGWLAMGHRSTGIPFDIADLEDLSLAADHVATAIENALLYDEVARQKSMAESLLHTLPSGIIACDETGVVRWFSTAAEGLLGLRADQIVGHPVETLGSRLADMMRRTLEGELFDLPQAWTDPSTRRSWFVQTRRLGSAHNCMGTLATVQDITAQRLLQEKQDQLERASFWNELAASMSHEIRNPLVAIKTFAQLLPERYQDSDFRKEFSTLVSAEVDRLNSIIDQIHGFAHPPELKFSALDIRHAIQRGIESVLPPAKRNGLRLSLRLDDDLPPVWGDPNALAESVGHLVQNAVEALHGRSDGKLEVRAARAAAEGRRAVEVSVVDNGPGIAPDLKDKVFSPFCTSKARGMGLGLPIVKRTIIDHNGRIEVESNGRGTAVHLVLPAAGNGSHA